MPADDCTLHGPQECEQLGITGLDISRELRQLPQQLPELMLAAMRDTVKATSMQQAVQHYSAFCAEAHAADSASGKQQQQQQQPELLPALAAVLSLDDADLHLREPEGAAPGSSAVSVEHQSEAQHSQRAGAAASQPSDAPAPDEVPSADAGGASIDWDVDLLLDAEPSAPGEPGDLSAEAAEIDWDIDLSAVGVQSEGADTATAHHSSAAPDDDRAPAWLAKLIGSADARNALLDDLYELVVSPCHLRWKSGVHNALQLQ